MYTRLQKHGPLLVVADQPATIGALAVAAPKHMGTPVAYLASLTMRHTAGLHPGDVKADEKDDSSLLMLHTACHTHCVNLQKRPKTDQRGPSQGIGGLTGRLRNTCSYG